LPYLKSPIGVLAGLACDLDVRVALYCSVRFAHGTRGRSLGSFTRAEAALAQDDNKNDDNKNKLAA
jgi:hypothetical protein